MDEGGDFRSGFVVVVCSGLMIVLCIVVDVYKLV